MKKQEKLGEEKEEKKVEEKEEKQWNEQPFSKDSKVIYIDPMKLKISAWNVRKQEVKKDLDKLVNSIIQIGVIDPLKITKDLEVISGQRRCIAAKEVVGSYGKEIKVPCIVLDIKKRSYLGLLSLVENMRFKPINEEDLKEHLIVLEKIGLSIEELSKATGESISTIQMIMDRVEPPSKSKRFKVTPQLASFNPSSKKLSHERKRLIKKLKKAFPDDVVKRDEMKKHIEKASLEEIEVIKEELKRPLLVNIKRLRKRVKENIPTAPLQFTIRTDILKKLKTRLTRETEQKTLTSIIIRLLELWADYKLCNKCDSLV